MRELNTASTESVPKRRFSYTLYVPIAFVLLSGLFIVGWNFVGRKSASTTHKGSSNSKGATGSSKEDSASSVDDDSEWIPVRRGDFEIACRDNGASLRPVKMTTLSLTSRGKISFIIAEGTPVKKGDRVLELETTDLVDRLQNLQKNQITQSKNLADQQQNREIEIKRMATDLFSERERLKVAQLKESEVLVKPIEFDKLTSLNSVKSSRARLISAQLAYDSFLPLVEMGFGSRMELETKRISLEQAKIEQERTQLKHQQLMNGALPEDKKRAALEREQAELSLKLKELDNDDQADAIESRVASAQREADAAQRNVDETQEKIKQSVSYAPHDGIVSYRLQGWGRYAKKADVGDNVNQSNSPIDLPSYDVMKVRAVVPESFVRRIHARSLSGTDGKPPRKGSIVRVMVKTLPDKIYPAEVTWIDGWAKDRNSELGDADVKAQGYSGVPVFNVEAELLESDPQRLREGFRAIVEFPIETLRDVLSIPAAAVSTYDGKIQVQVRTEKGREYREVLLGAKSGDRVVVVQGLTEKDTVFIPKAVQPKEKQKPQNSQGSVTPAAGSKTPIGASGGGGAGGGGSRTPGGGRSGGGGTR